MDFGKALEAMKAGKNVTRIDLVGYLKIGPNNSIRKITADNDGCYQVSNSDLFENWKIVEELPEVTCTISATCPKCSHVINLYDFSDALVLNCPCGFKYVPVKPKKIV